VNDLLLEILPDIDNALEGITRVKDEQDEVRQELILKIYENSDKVKELYEQGRLKGWIFIVGRNLFLDVKKRPRKVGLPQNLIDEQEEHYKPNIKTLDDMLQELPEIERLWIETYIDCGFNCSEIERRTTISRRWARERLNVIFEKWKQLDIYLQS
jgi:DNA-directed RNA polymerase specialized sigma24 family protein